MGALYICCDLFVTRGFCMTYCLVEPHAIASGFYSDIFIVASD